MVNLRITTLLSIVFTTVVKGAPAAVPPLDNRDISLGIHFETDTSKLPLLVLPYAKYRAATHDKSDDYYVFRNIRFAKPPVGPLRWRAPEPPEVQEGIQDGRVGYQCFQATPKQFAIGQPIIESLEPTSEDCLFLDVWVPGKAVRGELKDLPVLFWIFGGGYALGSKSFFVYDGSPLMRSAGMKMIYVAPNYRLGAFGFLNGPALTTDGAGLPNAGLHDQRAALQWVQKYISLVGGNPAAVTAMGESAGAGSIMHHLVAKGGTQDPLFRAAIIQSPAFEPQFDPTSLNKLYTKFETAAGCTGKGLDCLRGKSAEVLQAANKASINTSPYGTFGYGPGVDGDYIRDLPGLEMARGNYWKNMKVMVGHTSNEGILFTNPSFDTNAEISTFISSNFPYARSAVVKTLLEDIYPAPFLFGLFGGFSTNFERLSKMIEDVVVVCNTRYIAEAYAGNAYHYVFSIPPGIHAMDILLTFWRTDLNIGALQVDINIPFLSTNNYATGWQSYLTSFVRTGGDPNKYRQAIAIPPTINWTKASVGTNGISTMNMGLLGYKQATDGDAPEGRCEFWKGGTWTGRS